jgi:hypothetical protein
MRCLVVLIVGLFAWPSWAQLSNNLFRHANTRPENKYSISFEALQFLKNNEYFNGINPGETLFGFQTKSQIHYRINNKATFSAGLLLQHDFGDDRLFSKALPLFNLELEKKKWLFNIGNIKPHIHHNVNEALLSYENTMKQPAEFGLQSIRNSSKMYYDAWLEWRQKADGERDKHEEIVFGQSLEAKLFHTESYTLSMPIQAIVYHSGGQGLNLSGHVTTQMLGAAGVRLTTKDTSLCVEGFVFQSLDNSGVLSQPYRNGNAYMGNLRFFPHKYHELSFTWWFAREFVSPTGNIVFSNTNWGNAYQTAQTRRLAMIRWVYSRPLVANKIWMDLRLEPYYDFERKGLEMSQGLYFRYVEQIGIKLPRWMGF